MAYSEFHDIIDIEDVIKAHDLDREDFYKYCSKNGHLFRERHVPEIRYGISYTDYYKIVQEYRESKKYLKQAIVYAIWIIPIVMIVWGVIKKLFSIE